MSVLSSTRTGIRAYTITGEYLVSHGYTSNMDKDRFFYQNITSKFLSLTYNKRSGDRRLSYYFSYKGFSYTLWVDNALALSLVEEMFKLRKSDVRAQEKCKKRLLKYVKSNE